MTITFQEEEIQQAAAQFVSAIRKDGRRKDHIHQGLMS